MKANGAAPKGRSFTTNEYVKLNEAMRLSEYAVGLWKFPWLDPFRPFGTWDTNKPTQSIPWYDAYNAVKHDRESEFPRATLRHSFEATLAASVMRYAQYGPIVEDNTVQFSSVPKWTRSELYVAHEKGKTWTPVNCPL